IYTGCRPAELVDALKRAGEKTTSRKRPHIEVWDAVNNLDEDECVDEREGLDEPNYQGRAPWDNKSDSEYDDDYFDPDTVERKYKSLCYEDIRLWIVLRGNRNPRLSSFMKKPFPSPSYTLPYQPCLGYRNKR
ncbi:hypothetical protein V498_06839, partial [Pseudogymnoascus sp. VKM F-4517 (FW-2822)]